MTLPGPRLPRLDPVAVRAPDDALVPCNLGLDCGNGLQRRDVRGLALHVVDVERRRMPGIPAVNAPVFELEVRDPRLHPACASVLYRVDPLSVPVLRQPALTPSAVLLRGRLRAGSARSLAAHRGAVLRGGALRQERPSALLANSIYDRRVLPGRHTPMIPADERNPCKSDIFEATYERVDDDE